MCSKHHSKRPWQPSTQTAITSYTFSPSLQPITAPLVVQSLGYQSTFLCTRAKNQDSSAEVHIWTEAKDTSSASVSHQTCKIVSTVRSLHPLSSGEILAHHHDGGFCFIRGTEGRDFHVSSQSTSSSPAVTRWTHHISVLDRFASAAITRASPKKAGLALIVQISSPSSDALPVRPSRKGRKSAIDVIDAAEGRPSSSGLLAGGVGDLQLQLLSVSEDEQDKERVRDWATLNLLPVLQIKDAKEVKDVALFHSGRLAVCTANGRILTTTLKLNASGAVTADQLVTITLPSIAQNGPSPPRNAALQLLTSSTALLVVASPVSDSITALLIDLELACILSETSWQEKGVESPAAHRISGSTVLVAASRQDLSNKSGVTLWALQYEASEGSHLRWALANSGLTRKWVGVGKSTNSIDEGEAARVQLVKELQRIAADREGAAAARAQEEAFERWRGKESSRIETQWKAAMHASLAPEDESSDSEGEKRQPKGKAKDGRKRAATSGVAPKLVYPGSFVVELLACVLPATTGEGAKVEERYAKQIVHQLLSDQAVSNSLRPGILPSLMAVQDWEAVLQAVSSVHDLPELDIVDVLLHVTRNSITNGPKQLEAFLHAFVAVALNRAQVRKALKSRLENIDEIIAILGLLSNWLDKVQEEMLVKMRISGTSKSYRPKLANVDGILTLLCDLMDTYFPLFLDTPVAHQHLVRLSRQVESHLAVYNQLDILRGPLQSFARLQADKEREATLEAQNKLAQDGDEKIMSLRRASKKAVQGKDNAIGQVGGGLGKGVLGEKSRRRQMYEENVAVGLYSLEQLEL